MQTGVITTSSDRPTCARIAYALLDIVVILVYSTPYAVVVVVTSYHLISLFFLSNLRPTTTASVPHLRRPITMTDDEPNLQQPPASARSQTLLQLKSILLRHAEQIRSCVAGTANDDGDCGSGAAIVAALQSLLRCAEMRYRCCTLDDCEHAAFAAAVTSTTAAIAAATTSSLRSGAGGDNLCCGTMASSSSTQTVNFDGGGCVGGGSAAGAEQQLSNNDVAAVRLADSFTSDVVNNAAAVATDAEPEDDLDDDDDDDDVTEIVMRMAAGGEQSRCRRALSSDSSYITADEGYDVSMPHTPYTTIKQVIFISPRCCNLPTNRAMPNWRPHSTATTIMTTGTPSNVQPIPPSQPQPSNRTRLLAQRSTAVVSTWQAMWPPMTHSPRRRRIGNFPNSRRRRHRHRSPFTPTCCAACATCS